MIYLAGYLLLFIAALVFTLSMCRAAKDSAGGPSAVGGRRPNRDTGLLSLGVVPDRNSGEASQPPLPLPATNPQED